MRAPVTAAAAFGATLVLSATAWAGPAEAPATTAAPAEPTTAPAKDVSSAPPQPSPAPAEPVPTQPTVQTPTPAPSSAAVSDDVWAAMQGRQVSVETTNGPLQGELASSQGDSVVLVTADGTVKAIPKSSATAVKVVQPPPAAAPAPMPTQAPASTNDGQPAADGAANEGDEEETPAEKRRRERREKREHALLGAFTAHGAAYSHWNGDGINAGHAAYVMDWGIGFNATKGFGMYAMAGGVLAAKIDDKQVNANYGHVNLMFAFGGKYYQSMFGAGGGFSRLNFGDRIEKDAGLSVPFKLYGKIPLPKKLYIGIGLSYEFAAVRNFDRYINAIGGQIILGRW